MTGNKTKGFTLFYALLVASLALAIGASIYDLTLREIDLSGDATQSQYAVYMADSGAECALYWDNKCTTTGCNSVNSAFATSSASTATPANAGFLCRGVDITASASSWSVAAIGNAATTTFTILGVTFHNQTPCSVIYVAKVGNPAQTTVTAHGYNTCAAGAVQLERVFQVSY